MLLKTQSFEKTGNYSNEERFWPFFSRIIECHKPEGTDSKGPRAILTITVEVIRKIVQDLKGC